MLASLNAVNGHKMIDQFEEFQSLRLHCAWQYEPTSAWNSLSLKRDSKTPRRGGATQQISSSAREI